MPLAAYINWNASPEIFQIGPLTFRWYGLLMASGFLIGFFMVRWMFQIERKDEVHLNPILIYMLVGTVIGARLGHILFYEPAYYLANPHLIPAIWKGGLASHGAALGILAAIWWYTRKHRSLPFLWLLDRVVVPTALAGCFIRTGNLFNSEILGTPTSVPWAFVFVREDTIPRHPVQVYEAVSYLVIFAFLLRLYNRHMAKTPQGLLLGWFLTLVFAARFIWEFFKDKQEAYTLALPLSPGQLLSLPFIIAGAVLIWRARQAPARN